MSVLVFFLEKSENFLQRKLSNTFKRNYSIFKHLKSKPRNEDLGKMASPLMLPLPNESAGDNMDQDWFLSLPRVTWIAIALSDDKDSSFHRANDCSVSPDSHPGWSWACHDRGTEVLAVLEGCPLTCSAETISLCGQHAGADWGTQACN